MTTKTLKKYISHIMKTHAMYLHVLNLAHIRVPSLKSPKASGISVPLVLECKNTVQCTKELQETHYRRLEKGRWIIYCMHWQLSGWRTEYLGGCRAGQLDGELVIWLAGGLDSCMESLTA